MGHVISHRRPRRKRGRGLTARRFGVLAVTLAALIAAAWLAPYVYTPPPPIGDTPQLQIAQRPIAPKSPEATKVVAKLEPAPPVMRARAPRQARPVVPLDAVGHAADDGYEILSAAELAAISQARD